jgi:excisionase family DNA binding protein
MDTTASTRWLTVAASAQHAQVSVPTIRRAIRAGKLRAFALDTGLGRQRVRISEEDLNTWLRGTPAAGAQ